jgi:hypothetical protein
LSSGSRDQFCVPLAILIWSCVLAVLAYWGLVTLSHSLSLGQGQRSISQLSAVSVLCMFVDYFSILLCHLTLDVSHWFKRQALWNTICPISGSGSSPAHCQPICLSRFCLLKVHMEISSFPPPPSPVRSVHPAPSAVCSFSVSCLLFRFFFFFFAGLGQSVQGAMLVYPRGSCGNTVCCLFAHLLVCISQAGLELVSRGVGTLLFSQCNMAWKSFV